MKLLTSRLRPALLLITLGMTWIHAEEGGEPKKRVWSKEDRARFEAWESLAPEQREKLREALRDAWTDPAVINAREEVKQASDAYQAAIKAAVERVDPAVAALLAKVQAPMAAGGGPGGRQGGAGSGAPGPGGGGGGSQRGFDDQIKPPGFLDSLSPEARERFRRAEEAAMKSEAVKAARAELGKIREEDEQLRRRRIEAHRQIRRVTLDEMIRIDPSIEEIQKRLRGNDRGGAAPGKGGKGKGRGDSGENRPPSGENRPSGDRPSGDRPEGDRPSGDRAPGKKEPSAGIRPPLGPSESAAPAPGKQP